MNKLLGAAASCALALSLFSGTANANLIVNGSFEEPVVTNAGGWALFNPDAVEGWQSDKQIEIWSTYGLTSYDGEQHAELNADRSGPWSIWQDVETSIGAWYRLSFAAASRTRGGESFSVSLGGAPIVLNQQEVSFEPVLEETVALQSRQWTVYSYGFKAEQSLTRLTFTSVTPNSTMGNLIDDVSLVPAPSTLALSLLALFALAFRPNRASQGRST